MSFSKRVYEELQYENDSLCIAKRPRLSETYEVDLANERTPNLEQTMGNQIRGGYATLESFSETGFDINATSSLTISQETRSGFAKAPGHLFGIIGRYEEDEDDEEDDDWALGNENSSTNSSSEDGSLEQLKVPALAKDATEPLEEEEEEGEVKEAEKSMLQQELLKLGIYQFVQKYVITEQVPLKKLLRVFVKDNKQSNEKVAMNNFFGVRPRLTQYCTIDHAVELLKSAKKIMVLTGAGISVSCGIPDFRSKDGIYSRLEQYNLDDPQQLFDITYFREFPEIFYSFAKEIFPTSAKPSPSHNFIKLLEVRNVLLRNYTQNIDNLESVAGVERIIQCHGSFNQAVCIECGHQVPGDFIKPYIDAQEIPYCPKCTHNGKREASESVLKPSIVFFGESLPKEFDQAFSDDRSEADLLIVIGSSLKVAPVSQMMSQMARHVPQIVINRTPIRHIPFDIQLLGDCDIIIPDLCRRLEWKLEHDNLPNQVTKPDDPLEVVKFTKPNFNIFKGAEIDNSDGEESEEEDEEEEEMENLIVV